ncbi:MAG: N-acetylmuramoyl-L-alanine amidase [Pelagibacterales bacterium]|nr:N-acetylmuramoyl-L-alanine amidase [Pelagibacterales bacterium]
MHFIRSNFQIVFVVLVTLFSQNFSAFADQSKNLVKKIEFSQSGNLEILLSKKINDSSEFKIFTLKNPDRIVIDLFNSDFENKNYQPNFPSFISGMRTSLNKEGILRIVFDSKKTLSLETSKTSIKQNSQTSIITKITGLTENDLKVISTSKSNKEGQKVNSYKIKPSKKIIVIDAGHGGKDPGTIGLYARTKEKNITLSYAKELKKQLYNTGKYKVYLTRENDHFIPLKKRVEKSRKLKADLFISLHANSIDDSVTSGFSIYTLSETSSDKQAQLLAQKENRADIIAGIDFEGASKDIMKTLIDLSQRDSMNNSSRFANIVITSVRNSGVKVLQNTHRFAGFAVLTAPDVASVLIELGYLSNKNEEGQLNSLLYKRKIANSLAEAIDKYFSQLKN